jgi:hypothetical protein
MKFRTMPIILGILTPLLCHAAPTKEDISRAWSAAEAQRHEFTASVKTSLQIFNRTQLEDIASVERRIIHRREPVCDIDAAFIGDGVPVYESKRAASIRCEDLTNEFTLLHFDKVLSSPGWTFDRAEGNLLLYEIKWLPFNPRSCEEGLRGRMSVDASSLHPVKISLVAGQNCSGSTVFKPGSKIDVAYEKLEGVYQMTSITEEDDLKAQPYDQMRTVQFFWRNFTSRTHMAEAKVRITKNFHDFQRISRPLDITVNPAETPKLIEVTGSTVTFPEPLTP